MKVALCQCIRCERYLAENRNPDGTDPQVCTECRAEDMKHWPEFYKDTGLPLAKIRGTLTDPLSLECLALLTEEAGEVSQRVGKIVRWGWEADFEGTTQQHKLETELGDVVAAIIVTAHNVEVTIARVFAAADAKLAKLREDAAGPRQRLLHAVVPDASATALLGALALHHMTDEERGVILTEAAACWCRCGSTDHRCQCSNDE